MTSNNPEAIVIDEPTSTSTSTSSPTTVCEAPASEAGPETKKQKTTPDETTVSTESSTATMTDTTKVEPESPASEWPEAWYMLDDGEYEDQKAENRMKDGNKPCSVEELKKLGIA